MDSRCAEWYRLHQAGLSWAEIAARYAPELSGNAIKKRVRRWLRHCGAAAGEQAAAPPESLAPSPTPEVLDPHTLPADWVDRLWQNAKEQSRLRRAAKKEQHVFHIRVDEQAPIMFVWTADWHLLDAGTDHDLFEQDVQTWLSTPGIYIGIGGDLANWFSPAVLPRAMPANVLPSDLTEPIVRKWVATLRPRVLFGLVGNHDEFPAATGWHPVDDIYRDLGIPNLGPGGRVFLTVGDVQYQIEARHSFNFNSVLNDTNSHRQLWSQSGKPDMVFTAHLHHPTMHHRTFDGEDTVWARNGSYKRDDSFARSKNYVHTQSEPADQPGVILFPERKKMIPFRNYRDGLALLAAVRAEYVARQRKTA